MKPAVAAGLTAQVPPDSAARALPVPVAVALLGAEHWLVLPPLTPWQRQVQGEAFITVLGVPPLHKLTAGMNTASAPSAAPQTPSSAQVITMEPSPPWPRPEELHPPPLEATVTTPPVLPPPPPPPPNIGPKPPPPPPP